MAGSARACSTAAGVILDVRLAQAGARGQHLGRVNPIDDLLRARLRAAGDWQATSLRRAAVLCPLVQHEGEDHLLFVLRRADARQHAGQIAFPGGMRDGDETIEATARRECREEVGVGDDAITVLGALPARESSSGILVHAVVARLAPVPLAPDAREVVRVLHIPLAALREEARWSERPPPGGATGNQLLTSPHFPFGGDLVWGLTGRFVRDLAARLRGD
jgi:8-oxo-dGTP pyrophosphatase MutT (NUDIX family)